MRKVFFLGLIIGLLSACSPVIHHRGYLPDDDSIGELKVGNETKQTVLQKMGHPPTTGTFDQNEWYYISYTQQEYGFTKPEIIDQKILVFSFSTEETLTGMNHYGLEDGQVIDLNTNTTPTNGKNLNVIQQMLSNVGRFNSEGGGGMGGGIMGRNRPPGGY